MVSESRQRVAPCPNWVSEDGLFWLSAALEATRRSFACSRTLAASLALDVAIKSRALSNQQAKKAAPTACGGLARDALEKSHNTMDLSCARRIARIQASHRAVVNRLHHTQDAVSELKSRVETSVRA